MKITAAYIRISTHGQNEQSQTRAIKRWLKGHDTADVRFYVDKGTTGDNLDRPEFKRLQADIHNGEVKTVVVFRLDRLSRKLNEGINVLCDWLNDGIRVVTVDGHDFKGTTGKLIASVLLSVAEMEQETRRERQAAGIAAARERGIYIGRQAGTTKAKPARAERLRERGLTDDEIANSLGVSRRTVQRYLNSN